MRLGGGLAKPKRRNAQTRRSMLVRRSIAIRRLPRMASRRCLSAEKYLEGPTSIAPSDWIASGNGSEGRKRDGSRVNDGGSGNQAAISVEHRHHVEHPAHPVRSGPLSRTAVFEVAIKPWQPVVRRCRFQCDPIAAQVRQNKSTCPVRTGPGRRRIAALFVRRGQQGRRAWIARRRPPGPSSLTG